MASGATLTEAVDLGRTFQNVFLEIPALLLSATQLHVQAAAEAGGSFFKVMHPSINTSVAEANVFAIPSAATSRMFLIPNGIQHLKIESTAPIVDGKVFTILCSDL
jgi:hypothetical protein